VGFFFFACPGFFPFDPFLFCIKSFLSFMSLYVPYYRPSNKHNINIHDPDGIRTHDPSERAAEDPRLRPHDLCNWHFILNICRQFNVEVLTNIKSSSLCYHDTINTY
jgi:hypothetical protein